MNKLLLILLAGATSASFAAAPAPNNDTVAYKQMTAKAAADYKSARTACDAQSGNTKEVCMQEAKVARARSEAEAVAQYKSDKNSIQKAHVTVAESEYDLARARCAPLSGADKDGCISSAKATETAAINDAKAGKLAADVAQTGADCSTLSGTAKASCETRQKSALAGDAMADSMITTKIKADLIKEPNLKSLDVHVETTNGIVNLSGFVPSQAEVDKAVDVARNVKGVSKVQSSLRIQPK
ncbi:MAG: BON domain-containing protein [Sphingomonadaceae bacterium]